MGYLSWGLKRQVHIKVKHGIIYDDIYTTGHNSLFVRSFTAFKSQLNILTLGCYPLSTSKAGFVYFWPKIKVHFPNYFTALLGLKKLRRQRQERMISLRNRAFAEEHKKCNTELCSLKRAHTVASCKTLKYKIWKWIPRFLCGWKCSVADSSVAAPGREASCRKIFCIPHRTNIFQNIFKPSLRKKSHLGQIFYKCLPHLAGINVMHCLMIITILFLWKL